MNRDYSAPPLDWTSQQGSIILQASSLSSLNFDQLLYSSQIFVPVKAFKPWNQFCPWLNPVSLSPQLITHHYG
jgi:hypothetical protein